MNVNIKRYGSGSLFVMATVWLAGCSAATGIKPSQVSCTQYLTSQQTNKPAVAYSLLSSQCKSMTPLKTLTGFWATFANKHGKINSWSQTSFKVFAGTGGSTVYLGYVVNCAKGKAALQFSCVEENGQWLIQGFNYQI